MLPINFNLAGFDRQLKKPVMSKQPCQMRDKQHSGALPMLLQHQSYSSQICLHRVNIVADCCLQWVI